MCALVRSLVPPHHEMAVPSPSTHTGYILKNACHLLILFLELREKFWNIIYFFL